jgi:Carboxypeptidase regulatory-like domain/TonB dependent receptor/TonB-dependent Receptor Plug Domain
MFFSKTLRACEVACLFSLLVAPVCAQVNRNGAVAGVITGPDGSSVPAATISLTSADGQVRTGSATQDATFTLNDVASGSYVAHVTATGFAAYTDASVSVAVGRTTHLVIRLALAGAQESVSVNGGQTAFDTTQTSSVVNIDRDRVEESPIPNRNYLTFVLLAPQVAPANPNLAQATPVQAGGSFSFGGLRPGSNAVYLDGVDDDDEYSGSSRTELSPEAISDFQIVNHGFAAEAGGGAGGSVNVQTRAGGNQRHGDAFLFVQNGALNGTPPLELTPRKPVESRLRAGLAMGGALQPDRTFYYVAAEQELARGEDANDISAATAAQINSALRTTGPLAGVHLQAGFIPTTEQETEFSGRLDRTLTAQQRLMLRYAFTNSRNVNDAFNTDDLSGATARGSSFTADNSLNGALSSTFGTKMFNAVSFEVAQRRLTDRTASEAGPGVLVSGVALFGTPYFGNNRRYETHLELGDDLSWQRGHHLIQAGASIDRVGLRAQVLDGSQGLFVFPTLGDLQTGNADFFTQSFGDFDTNFSEMRAAAYVQDHWTGGHTLTVDYGLRYEQNRLPAGLPQNPYLFSPRLGFAWTPLKSLVMRGGFGIFYDRYLLSTLNKLLEDDGAHGFSQVVEDQAAGAIYRNGLLSSQPQPHVAPSIWRSAPNLANPYSEVASLSAEQALPLGTTLKAEYQYVHGVALGRTTNVNLPPPVLLTAQNAASLGISSPTDQQLGQLTFSGLRNNPTFDAINQFNTSANSSYNGATLTLNRQFTDDLQVLAGYTYSKTIDDASADTEQPQNPYDLRSERGLSLQDQRHRVTLSGLWLLGPDLNDPQDAAANAHPSALMRAVTGFEFVPIFSLTSGFRANPLVGVDSNREHIYPFAARPQGYGRNALQTRPNINFDFRVLRMIPIATGHLDVVAESFNLLNHENDSLLNTTYGSKTQPMSGFGQPIEASSPRRIQFSLDYEF